MTVYTKLLAQGVNDGSGSTVVYEAPADGTTIVVRDVELYRLTGGDRMGLEVLDELGGEVAVLCAWADVVGHQGYHWDGRQVLTPGYQLALFADIYPVFYMVTGYVLS